ncbi:hypothetical protein [Kitasatospora sp. McL0602]|uniref:hypothetical protein n=1 Tax=Kitasatospora sp. McL0602 TaxID=3439530 RepID=UPI003F8B0C22
MSPEHTPETPTERLLREALATRAAQITAHDLRPATPPARRRRPLRTVTVSLLALAAAATIGVVTLDTHPVADRDATPPAVSVSATPTPSLSPSPSPSSASPSPTASQSPTDSGTPSEPTGTAFTFRGIAMQLPPGWTTAAGNGPSHLCLVAPGQTRGTGLSGCTPYGVDLAAYVDASEAEHGEWPTIGDLASDSGWSHQPYCPVWGHPHDLPTGYLSIGKPTFAAAKVGGLAAAKTTWQVSCNATDRFTAQMWGLADQRVFVAADGLKADYQQDLQSIIDSMDFSGYAVQPQVSANKPVKVTIDGPTAGGKVPNSGAEVSFAVIWTNTSTSSYAAIEPVVATFGYEINDPVPMLQGTMERQDGSGWTTLPLSRGGGMDYASTGAKAAFSLAPGQSRTLNYRMKLTPGDQLARFKVGADAFLPSDSQGSHKSVGSASVQAVVVKG